MKRKVIGIAILGLLSMNLSAQSEKDFATAFNRLKASVFTHGQNLKRNDLSEKSRITELKKQTKLLRVNSDYKLDSTISKRLENGDTIVYDKTLYAYDENNFKVRTISYSTTTFGFVPSYQTDYTIEDGNIVEVIGYDIVAGNHFKSSRDLYSWNENNQLVQEIYSYWSEGLNDWESRYKYEYTYSNNSETTVYYGKDTWDGEWIPRFKIEDNFNNAGFYTKRKSLRYNRVDQKFDFFYQETYNYNSANLLVEMTIAVPNSDGATTNPIDSAKHLYSYWPNNKEKEYLEMIFDTLSQKFINSRKIESTYTETDKIKRRAAFLWNETSKTWEKQQKNEFNYVLNNEKTEVLEKEYEFHDSAWYLGARRFDVYDKNDNLIKEIYSSVNKWSNPEPEDWELELQSYDEYYYSKKKPSSVADIEKPAITLFPNPSEGNVSVRTEMHQNGILELYTIEGKSVFKKNFNGSQNLDISNLQTGIYLYKIRIANQVQSGKLMKM